MTKRIFPIEKYVVYDLERHISTCLKCDKELKGKSPAHIKLHYKASHKENVELLYSDYSASMDMWKTDFMNCCLGLVTVKNLPIQFFDDDQYLKKLIAPYEKAFGLNINSATMANQVSDKATKIKEYISNSVKNKMICLKIDVVTSMDKTFSSGILSIQYIHDFKMFTNTIGVFELLDDYSEKLIKREVEQCLKDFKIEIGQIYSCIPGGMYNNLGANIFKASLLLKESQDKWIIYSEGWDSADESGEEEDDYYKLSHVLAVIRCAEYCMQLAADDVFDAVKPNIDECRTILTTLQIIDASFGILEVTTKWSSVYNMFQSMECLRNYIDNTENKNTEVDWFFVSDFLAAFKPLYNCEIKFASVPYIIGDFYRDWLMCEVELEEIVAKNGCAQLLLEAMENRKARMLENEAFLSALYVDPRFNFINTPFLNKKQKEIAVEHLTDTNSVIKLLGFTSENEIGFNKIPLTSSSASNVYYKLERKMRHMAGVSLTDALGRNIEQKLENLAFGEWIPFESNVLEYWERFSSADPQLCKLVQIALSANTTQFSNDHVITALSEVITMDNRLSKQSINDLLLIKLNDCIIDNLDI